MATSSFFSDLPLNFIPNPVTGDLRPVVNENAVKAALINLLRTPMGDRPYRPSYGADLERYLFQPADSITESDINEEISDVIARNEPRVKIISIETDMTENSIDINIEYYVMNVSTKQSLSLTVTRTK